MTAGRPRLGNVLLSAVIIVVLGVLVAVLQQTLQVGRGEVRAVGVGVPGRIASAGITVTDLALTPVLRDEFGTESPCGAGCAFLVVTIEVADPGTDNLPLTAALTYGGVTAPPLDAVLAQRPGYAVSNAVAFAVDPAGLEGAVVEVWPLNDLRVYPPIVAVDLGIDRARLEQLAAAAPAAVEVRTDPERRPL